MPDYDERAELAPRDIVARANDAEIKRDGLDYVHLDISHKDPEFVKEHFPNIYDKLLGLGIDITKEPIPVVPAQHYTCGGVLVDLDGRTDAPGPICSGEVTQSGLHGANRLASNSLLECFVFGDACARISTRIGTACRQPPAIRAMGRKPRHRQRRRKSSSRNAGAKSGSSCGISSGSCVPPKGWSARKHRIDLLRREVEDYYSHFRVTPDLIELRNLVEVAELIIRSALSRHESRGLHYTLDYPDLAAQAVDTILVP